MRFDRRTVLSAGMGAALAPAAAQAQDRAAAAPLTAERIPLWPGVPPGAPADLPTRAMQGVSQPRLTVYRPARPDGRAVITMPGGGYMSLSVENEGRNVARALNPQNITVFVLEYRLPVDGWQPRGLAPLQDAQRAMRLVRSGARRFNIDPAKLGIIGFSSGGHLAASLATAYNDRIYTPPDYADAAPARPAFAGLIYPVTTLAYIPPRSQSRRNLLGPDPSAEALARFNSDARVTAETPPLFLLHAIDDPIVPVDMSLSMLAAARSAGVAAEIHLLERGGHGFGPTLAGGNPGTGWPSWFARWTALHV